MEKLMKFMEEKFSPMMTAVNTNPWVAGLKEAIMQTLPATFLGSLFCLLTIPGDVFGWDWWPNFWTPYGWTFGLLGLYVSFLVPMAILEKLKCRKLRQAGGIMGIVVYLMIINEQVLLNGEAGFGASVLGAGGMLAAMVAGMFSAFVLSRFNKFSFFKEDSAIPDFVRSWFDLMLPCGIIVVIAWILTDSSMLNIDIFNLIQTLFSPLTYAVETPWGFVLIHFFYCFIYSFGISCWVLTPLISPIQTAFIAENLAGTASHIFTSPLRYSMYIWIGGEGATLLLVIMMATIAKSKRYKALDTASLVPGLLNINEPVIFGAVAWNPILMIPCWLNGIILSLITYIICTTGLAPIATQPFGFWYCPWLLSGFLASGGQLSCVIWSLVLMIVSALIWYPFFKVADAMELKKEQEN